MNLSLTPRQMEIINKILAGKSQTEVAQEMGVTPQAICILLKRQQVHEALNARIEELGEKIITFKLDCVDAAIEGVARLKEFIDPANPKNATNELIRLASKDMVTIAGLEPRKRVLVESNNLHGIDEDTREFMQQVLHEAGVGNFVDAQKP